jgi:hypothetical protein
MLGPPQDVFRFKRLPLIVIVALGGIFFWAAGTDDSEKNEASDWVVFVVALALFALIVAWLGSLRISLHPEGISRRSIFGRKEIRWDELERYHYEFELVPPLMFTLYRFTFVDVHRRKLRCGFGLQRPTVFADKVNEATHAPLVKRLVGRFRAGEPVDFGAIRVNSREGIVEVKAFTRKEIPLSQLEEYSVFGKEVTLSWRQGKDGRWANVCLSLGEISNTTVLVSFLDTVLGRKPTRSD